MKAYDSNHIDALHSKMLGLGWTLKTAPENYDDQKQIALTRKDRSGGFSYTNKDGLDAYVSFAQKNSDWQGCDAQPLCRLSVKKSSEYQGIVSTGASYEIRPNF